MSIQSQINAAIASIGGAAYAAGHTPTAKEKLAKQKQDIARAEELKGIEALTGEIERATPALAKRLKKSQNSAYESFIVKHAGTEEAMRAMDLMGGNRELERQKRALARAANAQNAKRTQRDEIAQWIKKNKGFNVDGTTLEQLGETAQKQIAKEMLKKG